MRYVKYSLFSVTIIFLLAALSDKIYSENLKEKSLFSGEVQEWNKVYKGDINAELAIFGSSRAMIQINPLILRDSLQLYTYNLGLNGSKFKMQYYRFITYLKNNKKPLVIVWNLDTFSFSEIYEVFQPNQYAPFMLGNLGLYKYLKEYEDTKLIDFLLPLYRYRNQKYWQEEIKKSNKEIVNDNGDFRTLGFKSYDRPWKVNWKKLVPKDSNFDETIYPLLDKLIKTCKELDIQLIFTIAPEYYKGQTYMLNREEIIDKYKNTLNKYNLPLIDYSNDTMSYQQKWFYNTTHLNNEGADTFSKKLAKDLRRFIKN